MIKCSVVSRKRLLPCFSFLQTWSRYLSICIHAFLNLKSSISPDMTWTAYNFTDTIRLKAVEQLLLHNFYCTLLFFFVLQVILQKPASTRSTWHCMCSMFDVSSQWFMCGHLWGDGIINILLLNKLPHDHKLISSLYTKNLVHEHKNGAQCTNKHKYIENTNHNIRAVFCLKVQVKQRWNVSNTLIYSRSDLICNNGVNIPMFIFKCVEQQYAKSEK